MVDKYLVREEYRWKRSDSKIYLRITLFYILLLDKMREKKVFLFSPNNSLIWKRETQESFNFSIDIFVR
jgi:hypothetical protein